MYGEGLFNLDNNILELKHEDFDLEATLYMYVVAT